MRAALDWHCPCTTQPPVSTPHTCIHACTVPFTTQVVMSDVGATIPGVTPATLPRFLLDLACAVAGGRTAAQLPRACMYVLPLVPVRNRRRCVIAAGRPLTAHSPHPPPPSAAGTLNPDKLAVAIRSSGSQPSSETLGVQLADALW